MVTWLSGADFGHPVVEDGHNVGVGADGGQEGVHTETLRQWRCSERDNGVSALGRDSMTVSRMPMQ